MHPLVYKYLLHCLNSTNLDSKTPTVNVPFGNHECSVVVIKFLGQMEQLMNSDVISNGKFAGQGALNWLI